MSDMTVTKRTGLKAVDPVWSQIRDDAEKIVQVDTVMGGFLFETVLSQPTLEDMIARRIADRLDHEVLSGDLIRESYLEMIADEPEHKDILRADIVAVYDRDPACNRPIEPVLYFKGFHALQGHRLSHWLWRNGRKDFALYLQSRMSEVFQVDIHPAVSVGRGVFVDHATGIVVGSTACIEDDVSILQGVTLGGTGKETGDRHPNIRRGVLIGAGAKILGNIEVGCCSRVAAGSVVLQPVPPETTVAGVPAKIVGKAGCSEPSRSMNQMLNTGDGT